MALQRANKGTLPAGSWEKAPPSPPPPGVIASFHTAATFSRNDFCLIFIKLGKSFAISLTPYVVSLVLVIMMILNAFCSRYLIHNWKFQIPSTNSQGISNLHSPQQLARLMVGA